MCARKFEENPARSLFNRKEERSDTLTWFKALARNLLIVRHNCRRASKVEKNITALNPLHCARDNLSFATLKLTENGDFFRLAYFLDDHLLRGLCGNAPEIVLRLERKDEFLVNLHVFFDASRILEENMFLAVVAGALIVRINWLGRLALLVVGLVNHAYTALVDDEFNLEKLSRTGVRVELRTDDLATLAVLLLVSGGERCFNRLEHAFAWHASLFFELTEELSLQVAQAVNSSLDKTTVGARTETRSLDAMLSYSEGLKLLEQDEYQAAFEKFNEALAFDPNYRKAQLKAESLTPMLAAR